MYGHQPCCLQMSASTGPRVTMATPLTSQLGNPRPRVKWHGLTKGRLASLVMVVLRKQPVGLEEEKEEKWGSQGSAHQHNSGWRSWLGSGTAPGPSLTP